MNLGSYNFYNFNTNESLKEKAIQTLRNYGVGPCGPRGFYGTQDVHMKTEADVASFLGTASCIIYSQAFSTISSVIPAFSKRGDIIVADKGVNFAIRKGIQISRSMVRWYEHNDMEDLDRVLAKVTKEQARKPLTRRFIITEGLFESYGDMVNLPKIVCFLVRVVLGNLLTTESRLNSSSNTNFVLSWMSRGRLAFSDVLAAASPSIRMLMLRKWT